MGTGDSGLSGTGYTPQLDDNDECSSEYDITWSPGDGFNHCCQSKTDDWENAALTYLEGIESFQYYLSAFLGLFENISLFYHCLPGAANILGRLKSFLVKTIENSNSPVKYRTKTETKLEAAIPVCVKPLCSGYFINIVLAWSYIISCRWILYQLGIQIEDFFWDIVIQGCWVARVEKFKGVFYSPWMVRREGSINKRGDLKPVISNSSLAFDILLDFCLLEGLEGEFITGFAAVLILTSRHAPPPKFASAIMISAAPICISLSSIQDALDSLLCSIFFDPRVPCNLVGAVSLGVKKALSTVDKIDNCQLLSAVTNIKPYLMCNDQVTLFLNMALYKESITSRALEFQTSYFCRPELSVPWSTAPPLGTTPVENLSLDVRAHLAHIHRPIFWRLYWILDLGERVPASAEHYVSLVDVSSICYSCATGHINELTYPEQYIANEQSGYATSRLFNWHRSYDDGIWLDDGQRDIESVRQVQKHPWIIDPFDSPDDEPVEEPKHHELCVERILQWNSEVQSVDRRKLRHHE
ncbi:hypothetical protein F9C07_2219557 [Aspergillus flavus]|uniref:Uncharacterized protein n=1 Tax=Aspergillus flavus (strain ATCC 200026 / FGSC A1120 / IAM 13836 / NRRL 3357 / JCM 12722 / SRRC 167) TaxID=332952 RepID=A0A7U2MSW8_ASPFN|nr:hypothetical protein F9C07_2219557 [Aspergillus flavus]